MYNKGRVIIGIIVLVVIFTSPFLYNLAIGRPAPQLEKPATGKCVESVEYMRANHMDMLNQWRDLVVRQGNRIYVATDGTEHNMSLTETCLNCHEKKSTFCDRCHAYEGVAPACFNCHINPEEVKR